MSPLTWQHATPQWFLLQGGQGFGHLEDFEQKPVNLLVHRCESIDCFHVPSILLEVWRAGASRLRVCEVKDRRKYPRLGGAPPFPTLLKYQHGDHGKRHDQAYHPQKITPVSIQKKIDDPPKHIALLIRCPLRASRSAE